MTIYAKIENNKLITAYNGYNGIIGLADSSELCLANGFVAYTEEEVSGYFAGTHKIIDGVLTDISQTSDYKAKVKVETKKQITLSYKDKFNEFDGVYAARVVRGLSTTEDMNTKRTTLQTELTTKLQEVDNG